MLNSRKNILKLIFISSMALVSFYIGFNLYRLSGLYGLSYVNVKNNKETVEKVLAGNFNVIADKKTFEIPSAEIKTWTETYVRSYSGEEDIRIKTEKISDYLETVAQSVNTEPVDAKLKFENSKADVFVPAVEGKKLNTEKTMDNILNAMFNGESTAEIYFDRKEPKITLEKINNLGINTLIGRGESDFSGSPASRIHNIKVGIGKFNGTIVGPGEEFSFNSLLGEVDEKNGYQPELVIKEGKLIYEYGGGLCQVSTTIFRSAILSGLPILERKPHSFPVRYYNPQGFDSTVYPGVVDLRFKNDTPSHILIQGKVDKTKLVVEIYGSSDGRDISIEGPYQYDQQSNGAMKAYFIRKIASNGETKEERFNSSYRPPPTSKEERNPLE